MPIRLSGLASGMDTESIVAEMMKAQRLKLTKIENKKTRLEWKNEKWQDLNKKLYAFYTGSLNSMKLQGTFNTKTAISSNTNKVAVTAGNTALEGSHQIKVIKLATAQYVTGAATDELENATSGATMSELGIVTGVDKTINVNGKDITVTASTKVSDLVADMKSAGINASFDSTHKRFYLSSMGTGAKEAFSITGDAATLSALGLGTNKIILDAQDSEIEYNGATMKSSSNSVEVNGLTFQLLGETGEDAVNINVKKDTQAVYDKIKGFVKEYNELLAQMNEFYYASTAKGFEPLTEEQKSAMSEKEIEKWEAKIKDSLLRRDDGIGNLMSLMRTSLSKSVQVNLGGGSKSYSLSTFGIKSSDYTEKGILHIDGDKDDSKVSEMENKLMKALEEDPEAVIETFNDLAGELYDSFKKEIMGDGKTKNPLRSALTFYNDKEIKSQIDDYKDKLSVMERKLEAMESRYYKQFTAMEKAMSEMNTKSNYLASMLGTGNK